MGEKIKSFKVNPILSDRQVIDITCKGMVNIGGGLTTVTCRQDGFPCVRARRGLLYDDCRGSLPAKEVPKRSTVSGRTWISF